MPARSNAELAGPFAATTYRAEAAGRCFDLRIGELDAGFDRFLADAGVGEWAVITACNPGARALPAAENALRQQLLGQRLRSRGFSFLPCRAIADGGDWPVEEGFLVLAIEAAAAGALGASLGQRAVVCGRRGEPAQLVWCADCPPRTRKGESE